MNLWFSLPKNIRIVLILAIALAVWEILVRSFRVPEILVPPPARIFSELGANWYFYALHTWRTFLETAIGFALAVSIGIVLSMIIVSSRFLEEAIYTLLVATNAVPKVAIAPLFVVWMGTGLAPKIAISSTIALFVIVIDVVLGFRSVEREKLELARVLRGSKLQALLIIRLPHALPHLFAGMKTATTLALIGSVVGEFVASDRGLGYAIMVAQGAFDTVQIFACIAILGALGMVLFLTVEWVERLALPWHGALRGGH